MRCAYCLELFDKESFAQVSKDGRLICVICAGEENKDIKRIKK